jgi:hypothetical protein
MAWCLIKHRDNFTIHLIINVKKVELSLCLIKHYAMKEYGGVDVQIHVFYLPYHMPITSIHNFWLMNTVHPSIVSLSI